jgi:hypothetical protein
MGRGFAEPRETGKPLQIAVDSALGTTEGPERSVKARDPPDDSARPRYTKQSARVWRIGYLGLAERPVRQAKWKLYGTVCAVAARKNIIIEFGGEAIRSHV